MLSIQQQNAWKENMKGDKMTEYKKILSSKLGMDYLAQGLTLNVILIPLVLPFIDEPLQTFKIKLIEVAQLLSSDI